jgi:hypothetical protein
VIGVQRHDLSQVGGGSLRLLQRPELSRFLGIIIAMYYREHGPAHFHAIYGDFEVTVEIESGRVNGSFPPRALGHVQEWRQLHRLELAEAWSRARAAQPLSRIEPLE